MEIQISVIVLTYNQQDSIARTLDSILSQKDAPRFEILIGDDCSTDDTEKVCREYASKFPDVIRYCQREENVGLNSNYYECLADARGKYIADCAGDDYWIDSGKLRMQYDLLESDPSVMLVHTAWTNGEECYRLSENVMAWEKGEAVSDILAHDPAHLVHLCTAMYRKTPVWNAVKSNPGLFIDKSFLCEDLQLITAVATMGKIMYFPDVTLHYSMTEDSVSRATDFGRKFRQLVSNMNLTRLLADHYGIKSQRLTAYYTRTLDYMSAQVFHSGSEKLYDAYCDFLTRFDSVGKTKKQRVRDFLMSNKLIWRIARGIYHKDKSE